MPAILACNFLFYCAFAFNISFTWNSALGLYLVKLNIIKVTNQLFATFMFETKFLLMGVEIDSSFVSYGFTELNFLFYHFNIVNIYLSFINFLTCNKFSH